MSTIKVLQHPGPQNLISNHDSIKKDVIQSEVLDRLEDDPHIVWRKFLSADQKPVLFIKQEVASYPHPSWKETSARLNEQQGLEIKIYTQSDNSVHEESLASLLRIVAQDTIHLNMML